jgi:ABC-type branched-subunit amino acid transport system substrate-binding protein
MGERPLRCDTNETSRRDVLRGGLSGLGIAAAGCLVSACGVLPGVDASAPAAPQPGAAAVGGSSIGTGSVKIGLLLPLGASGQAGAAALTLRNSAELSVAEFQNPNIQLLVKDDKGTPEGARAAAQQAIAEGAELIIGPLFAASVQAAAQVARAANRPIIAFSTDASVASRGVYLLSFMPESEVERVIAYAAAQGRRSFAALIPETAYGNVVEAAFQQAVSARGGRLAALERYPADRAKMEAQVKRVAGLVSGATLQADALFIPDSGDSLAAVAQILQGAGVNPGKVKMLGTGIWNDPRALRLGALQGGWFAAPDSAGFTAFAGRYRAKFGTDPTRIGTLAFDAVSLAAALERTQGTRRFADATLTNASGFSGADGVFRFKPDGTNERGLAVLEVRNGAAVTISPAPRTLSAGA